MTAKKLVGVLFLCLAMATSALAELNWDTSTIWQRDPSMGRRLFFGVGFQVGSDGRAQVGGEYSNTSANVVWGTTPLTDGWGAVADNRVGYGMTTGVRNGHMDRLPNGNLIFIWDGRNDIGDPIVEHRVGYAFYDAVEQEWSEADYALVDTLNLGDPRVAVSGNELTDVHIWGTMNSRPTYVYYTGTEWAYETILDITGWHSTTYRREGAFATDSQGRPIAMVYNRTGAVNALQLLTRTGVDTWEGEAVEHTTNSFRWTANISVAAFALYNDIPFVAYMTLQMDLDEESGRRGKLYLTHKTGGEWAEPILLDGDYLTANPEETTVHIAINSNGAIAITYTYLEKGAQYPLGGGPDNPAIGETRFILGNANTLEFGEHSVVPVPEGATYNAYFDGRVVFDFNDPQRIHLIQRTNYHSNTGGDLWRDAYYATMVISASDAPSADNVAIDGEPLVGQTLTGTYDFVGESDLSTFRWLRADTEGGEYTAIDGATSDTYTLTAADAGKFFKFEVTPFDGTTAGTVAASASTGPVYVLGDFNGDGVLSGLDIPGFKQALADPDGWAAANPSRPHPNDLGDFNGDGVFSGLDIPGFKQALAGQ